MNYVKRPFIGIKGTKGSGKDTIASMIHYILGAGTTAASFKEWERYIKTTDPELDVPTLHFADKLKDDLSEIFGITRTCFDSHEYKDKKYFHLLTKSFKTSKQLEDKPLPEITIEDLRYSSFAVWADSYNWDCVIKLRTLMQYYGTEVIRNQLGKDSWVNVVINKAINSKNYYGYAIIADVRFNNEEDAIKNLGGKIIYVHGRNNKVEFKHDSETINVRTNNYVIDNNGNLMGLFYKVLQFVIDEIV